MWYFITWADHIPPVDVYSCSLPQILCLGKFFVWELVQEAEIMIGHYRDLDLLSIYGILFLIGGSELFFADMNAFHLKMIFAAAWYTYIVILLVILLGLFMSTKKYYC